MANTSAIDNPDWQWVMANLSDGQSVMDNLSIDNRQSAIAIGISRWTI